MTRREQEISTYETTIGEMLRMAREHAKDCAPYAGKSVFEFYDYVRKLPYKDDPEGIEHMSRPRYTLSQSWEGPRDCDDKTLALAAYCELHKIPYRIVVCGERETPHHVYPEIKLAYTQDWLI